MALSRSNQMIPELEAPGWLTRLTEAADKAYGNTMDILRAQQRDRRQILRKDNELKESRELNRKLETELVKCHEQIFRSIDTSNVSDASILDGLTSLQAGLSNWIETLPDSQQFSQNWTELHNFLEDNGFVTIDIDSKPEVIGRAEPELLIAVTFGILWTILFKPGPLGVSPDICSFLDTIQTNMSLVESKKDRAAINSWRSDMFRAWAKSPQYAGIVEGECRKASDMIVHALKLGGLVGDGEWKPRTQQLIEQILEPAAGLATQIRCSTEEYSWNWASSFPAKVLREHLNTWECINLGTHCQIKRDRMFSNGPSSAVIGDFIMPIFPPLHKLRGDGQDPLLIGKGKLLVDTNALATAIKEKPKSPKPTQDDSLQPPIKHEHDTVVEIPGPVFS